MSFALDERLAADASIVGDMTLTRVLLMNDARWPWLILAPRRDGVVELTDLDAADRTQLIEEAASAAGFLKLIPARTRSTSARSATSCASFICTSSRARSATRVGRDRSGALAPRSPETRSKHELWSRRQEPGWGLIDIRRREFGGANEPATRSGLRRPPETVIRRRELAGNGPGGALSPRTDFA